MSNHEQKQKKSRWLVISVLLLVLVGVLTAAAYYFVLPLFDGDSQPTEPTEPSIDTSVPDDDELILYYNVDREQYAGKGEDGLTARKKDPDTGYYIISFAGKGRVASRRVINRSIATKIDSQEVMSLVLNEDGVVTDLITVDECAGGYYMLGKHLYVSAVDGNKLTLHGNHEMQGIGYTLEYTSDTKIYDVSALAAENGTQGNLTTVVETDEILAVLNKDGSVGWIYVVDRVKPVVTRTRWCDHCKKEVVWTEWDSTDSLPTGGEGHYYLPEDVLLKSQVSMEKNATLIFDLNGHTVESKSGNRVFSLHNEGAYLAIMDYSEEQTGKVVAGATKFAEHQGGCVWVRYGLFELYGGMLDASNYVGSTFGMAVQVTKEGEFKMHGGKIVGGTSIATYESAKNSYKFGYGGAVSLNGKFEMNGGVIDGGYAEPYRSGDSTRQGAGGVIFLSGGSEMTMNGGVIQNGSTISGGNVYVSGNATFNMNGGTLKNGVAANGGGNLFLGSKAIANLSGGEIVNGETTGKGKNGGSIYVTSNSTLNMYGGWIYGGTSRNCGGNMVVYGTFNMYGGNISNGRILDYATGKEKVSSNANVFIVNSTFNMYGGTIAGHVQPTSTTGKEFTVTLSGTPKIKTDEKDCTSLYIPTGKTINVGELKDGAEVYVTASGTFTTETAETNKNYIHCDVEGAQIDYFDKCLFIGNVQCVCGASRHEGHEHIGDCDGTLHAFNAWTNAKALPTASGYYYLTTDVVPQGQASIKGDGTEVVLDLNGHTVNGKEGGRIYALFETEGSVTLRVTDSSEAQTGKIITHTNEGTQGGVIWVRGTNAETPNSLYIYAGTYDASEATLTANSGVAINATGLVNMYGGKIIGGTAGSRVKEDGSKIYYNGGAVYVGSNSTFNMYDGSIEGGKAAYRGGNLFIGSNSSFTMYNGTISGGSSDFGGGNICVDGKGIFTMLDGTVSDGTTENLGGNIFINNNGAAANLNGGTVTGGMATGNGGNVKVTTDGLLVLDGAKIENGTSKDSGANVVVYGTLKMMDGSITGAKKLGADGKEVMSVQSNVFVVNGTVDMSGGTIDGHMSLYGTHNVTLSGTAKIKATDGGTSLNIPANNKINVGKMEEGAEVYVTATGIFSTETDEANAKYFRSDNAQTIAHYQGCLAVGRMQCLCGASLNGGEHVGNCDEELRLFTAWSSKDSLPTTTGNYYLTNDVALNGQTKFDTDADVALDLNGHTVTGKEDVRVFAFWTDCKVTLSIADSSADKSGKVSISGSGTNQGMLFWFRAAHMLNLYGGTFDAGAATLTGNNGTAINCAVSGATINMYGGKLIGGTAAANEKGNGGAGGAVYLERATFNMFGGSIEGGNSVNGGNVYLATDAVFTMSGGTISGGKTTGNGRGGNVNLGAKNAKMTMSGNAVITGGTTEKFGGNIYLHAAEGVALTMNGGTISGGQATGSGGNVYVHEGTNFTMTDGLVTGGTTKTTGGNIYCRATVEVSGGSIENGTADKGGNIYIDTVENAAPSVTLSGNAKVVGGMSTGNGGNINVSKGTVLNVNGGTISGGTTKDSGGNVVLYGTMNMTDGEVKEAKKLGADGKEIKSVQSNVFIVNGTFTMSGGTLDGHMSLYGTHNVTLSGTAKIKATDGGTSLNISENNKINVGTMADGAEVYVTATGVFSTETDEANAKYFHTDNAELAVVHYDGCLAVGRMQCICGASLNGGEHIGDCDGTLRAFLAWTKTDSLPTTAGNYYLTKNVNLSGQATIRTNANVVLDLNGKTVTGADGARIYALWTDCTATLSVTDSGADKTGKMITKANDTVQGGIFWLRGQNHTLNLYGGTFDATNVTGYTTGGAVINTTATGVTINMYGGTLTGGTTTGSGAVVYLGHNDARNIVFNMSGDAKIVGGSAKNGGAVFLNPNVTMTMSGNATISGGTATTGVGGNVYVEKGSTLTLKGNAKVENGTASAASGGNVAIAKDATLTATGGTITGGTAATGNGGNLYVATGGKANLTNAQITAGKALRGGNVAVFGTATFTGGKIEATDTTGTGFNLFLYNAGKVTLDGTTVTAPTSSTTGISLNGDAATHAPTLEIKGSANITNNRISISASASVTMSGGTYTNANTGNAIDLRRKNNAGTPTFTMTDGTVDCRTGERALYVDDGAKVEISGGKVYGGTSSYGTVAYLANENKTDTTPTYLTLSGNAELYGGTGAKDGGAVYADSYAVVTMSDNAKITGCAATGNGGSVRVNANAKLEMSGSAVITGGSAVNGGNVYGSSNSTINLGGTAAITDGTASGLGGNVYLDGTMTVSGTASVSGGKAASGGNVYLDTGSFTMNGGTVENGTANASKDSHGGNVYVNTNGTFTLNANGAVKNGATPNGQGGNFYLRGKLVMTGGAITTTGTKADANIRMTALSSAIPTLEMSGGEINGAVALGVWNTPNLPSLKLSGDAKIVNAAKTSGVSLGGNGELVEIADGFTGEVFIAAKDDYKITKSADSFDSNIVLATGWFKIYDTDGYRIYDGSKHRMQCVCGVSLTGGTQHVGDCDGTLHLFDARDSLPTTAGYYYLTKNVTTGSKTLSFDGALALDLNGYKVTGNSGSRIYVLNASNKVTLSVTDSSAEKTGAMITHITSDAVNNWGNQGGIFWVRGAEQTLNLYGGTFDASEVTDNFWGNGAAINAETAGATINMYAGTIKGGKTGTDTRTGNGGAVYIKTDVKFKMSGGTISGGSANGVGGSVCVGSGATFNMSGTALITGGAADKGGNVYVGSGAMFTMSGGTIKDGSSTNGAGNVYLDGNATATMSGTAAITGGTSTASDKNGGSIHIATGATFNLNGGTISGGKTGNRGGNINLNGTLNMTGGTISGGKKVDANGVESVEKNANIFVVNGKMNMSGGTIDGHVELVSYNSGEFDVTLSGTAKIKATDGGTSLTIPSGKKIKVDTMADGAEVYVTATRVFSETTDAANAAYFHSDNAAQMVSHYEGCLAIGRVQCVCGASLNGGTHVGTCDGTLHLFDAWTSTTSLPTTTGNYYLTDNVTVSAQTTVGNASVVLDLNGRTVSTDGGNVRIYVLYNDNAELSVTDSGENGKLLASNGFADQGGIIWLRSTKKGLNIYGGTFDASAVTSGNTMNGVAINAENSGTTINMYGGKVIGGTTTGYGGAVSLGSSVTFNMTGGTIENGTAARGGNIYSASGSTVTFGGTAKISGGTATSMGGNLFGQSFTMTGGTIENGTAASIGGNTYTYGTVTMSGGEIKNGTSTGSNGGNLYLDAALNMSGTASISGGTAKNGGNVYLANKAAAVLTMNGGTITGGHSTTNGGNVYVHNSASLTMNGGSILNGKSDNEGGNVWNFGTLTMMTGSSISGGTAKTANGANVNMTATTDAVSKLDMRGGTIDGAVRLAAYEKTPICMVSGDAKIINAARNSGVSFSVNGSNTPATIAIQDDFNGEVYVDAAEGYKVATASADNFGSYIVPKAGLFAFYEDGGYTLYDSAKYRAQCVCGASLNGGTHVGTCDGTLHRFEKTTTIPNTAGYWYLDNDVTTGQQNLKFDGTMALDLNGHTITGNAGARIYAMWDTTAHVTMHITDSSADKTGKMITKASGTAQGGAIWMRGSTAGHTLNLYGGTIDASGVTDYTVTGAAINAEGSNATLNMYGGKVIGGTTTGVGGAVRINGKFNMTGGSIEGGKAANGGNVYVGSGATFNMNGGTITGGTATGRGSNVYLTDATKLTLAKNTVLDGVADATKDYRAQCVCGASLNGSTTHVGDCDGTVSLFTAHTATTTLPTATGKYYLTDNVTVSAQTEIKDGNAVTLDLNGHTIQRANSRIFRLTGATLNLTDSTTSGKIITKTGNANQGGVVWMTGVSTLNIYGGTLDASQAASGYKGNGAAINAESAGTVINMYGGKIIGGTTTAASGSGGMGGAVYLNNAVTFNMKGGSIEGGKATKGGSVCLNGTSAFTMTGGSITANEGEGGVYVAKTASFTNNGGTVSVTITNEPS